MMTNQPRFDFGDKVKVMPTGEIFTVACIYHHNNGEFRYSDRESHFGILESMLELHNSLPRKLYAYEHAHTGEVIFHTKDSSPPLPFIKVPQYDLSYGDTYV
jgi:hypothetical protein